MDCDHCSQKGMNGYGSMADGTGKPATASACASCRHQRKRCGNDCVFAPYFPASRAKDFLAVQKVFGVSNVLKMLQGVEENHRRLVAESLLWEATCRQQDPIRCPYGEFQRVQNELRYYQSMAAAWQKPPLQSHQPYKPALPGTALVEGRYANTKNHNKSKEANGITSSNGSSSNTSVTNFAGGGISTFSASIPTYALDSGSSAIDLSPYGSMSMHTDGQRQEIVLNHQDMEAAPVHAIPYSRTSISIVSTISTCTTASRLIIDDILCAIRIFVINLSKVRDSCVHEP